MPISEDKLRSLLEETFSDAEIEIKDLVGDRDHYEVSITSAAFSNVSKVQQHRLVMDSLGGIVGTTLHAISIKTYAK
ncbi:MAG: BolA/IbaG family iron-sulfur metabolism protein [Candidatus Jidaibacter sp.]|jgi:stress-induced morphogen|nr:BolA/IbaG family iron-sulfur metabolism protein [Candidatus Jidaibacter sp.]